MRMGAKRGVTCTRPCHDRKKAMKFPEPHEKKQKFAWSPAVMTIKNRKCAIFCLAN
jgi:hypothetical protein